MTTDQPCAGPTILLVDDSPTNLRVLYHSLSGRGYRLLVANSGEQALDVARGSDPDLVLLDIVMPGMDGFEVCRCLKADPATARSAVIYLSALDNTDDKIRGLTLGAVDYITKPVHPDEVLARVETHWKVLSLERDLASRNRQLELVRDRILQSMGEGVIGIDRNGSVTFANLTALRMLGRCEETLLGMDLADLDQPALSAAVAAVLSGNSGGVREVSELRLASADAREVHTELRIAPIREEDQTTGAVLVLHDLSEQRRAQADLEATNARLVASNRDLQAAQMRLIQAAKLESVGRLSAGVAHEVKNPLAIIQLGLDYLKETAALDATAATVVEDMLNAVSRADRVLRGLLDFSRERRLNLAHGNVNDVINQSIALVRHELTQRSISLETDLAPDLPACPLDRDKLQQVFINLFMNAMQAMEHGGNLCIRTRCGALDLNHIGPQARGEGFASGQQVIEARVEDTGAGVRAEHLDRLFDPFFTTKPTGQGTGLGLSVTRNIVKLHGGSIDIDNRPQGGAVATLLFKHRDASP